MNHYTAWVTTDPSCLDGPFAVVVVLQDEIFGYRLDDNGDPDHNAPLWESTGEQMFSATTGVPHAADGDFILKNATGVLDNWNWTVTTEWQAVTTGYVATAVRKGEI